ncbi:MAG TPA: hypothetical protein VF169_11195 [Albitalea sp.]|uniref:hypothetical protein n=1 Tax=Piscinibacter sp. TaxID=1903157 RepID=UPI002ED59E8B
MNALELVAGVLAVVALPLPWLAPMLLRAAGPWGYLLSVCGLCGVTLLLTREPMAAAVVAAVAMGSVLRPRGEPAQA